MQQTRPFKQHSSTTSFRTFPNISWLIQNIVMLWSELQTESFWTKFWKEEALCSTEKQNLFLSTNMPWNGPLHIPSTTEVHYTLFWVSQWSPKKLRGLGISTHFLQSIYRYQSLRHFNALCYPLKGFTKQHIVFLSKTYYLYATSVFMTQPFEILYPYTSTYLH